MTKLILGCLGLAIGAAILMPSPVAAQRRAAVRHPVRHTRLVLGARHPIRRALPATVVVRAARTTVVVGPPLVYLPVQAWVAAPVSRPAREQLLWEDSEVLERDEGWVDTNFGIDRQGMALFMEIRGRAQISFAEATFANGNVQVVDFNDETRGDGMYKLLDFADGRHVKTVRVLGKSSSEDTRLTVYLAR